MAIITNDLHLIGAMGSITAYKMNGSDKIIVRRKGGASKEQMKHSPPLNALGKTIRNLVAAVMPTKLSDKCFLP